jgi:DNA repair protein RadC
MSGKLQWHHPGGKLRELGPDSVSDAELLAILISPGVKDRPETQVADDILAKSGPFKWMQPASEKAVDAKKTRKSPGIVRGQSQGAESYS